MLFGRKLALFLTINLPDSPFLQVNIILYYVT